MLQVGEVIGDTYQLERQLGQGGMGEVWLARHLLLDDYRAIKIVLGEVAENAGLRERFIRGEARNSLRLERHPNIVRIYELGQHKGMPYMVMEYVEGQNLRQLLNQRKVFSVQDVAIMLQQLAEALEVAHRQGMVHRDIKPANVMVDGQGVLKLGDFGLTKDLDASKSDGLTITGEYLGTPAYTAPEQMSGQSDRRSDIYSLGAMIFELLTGRPPFVGAATSVIVQHVTTPPPSLCSLNPQIPAAVEQVVLKALAKRPEERYQSALEFSRAFQQALRGGNAPIQIPTLPYNYNQTPPPQVSYRPNEFSLTPAAPPSAPVAQITPPPVYVNNSTTQIATKSSSNKGIMLIAGGLLALIVIMTGAIIFLLQQNNQRVGGFPITPGLPATNPTIAPATTAANPATTLVGTTPPATTAAPLVTTAPATTVPATTTPPPISILKRGKLIFTFTQNGTTNTGLKRLNLANNQEQVILGLENNDGQSNWIDNNNYVYVHQTDRTVVVVLDGLAKVVANGVNPSFSSDGKKLLYVQNDQIYLANLNGQNPVQLTSSVGPKLGPRFSPDGTKIVYTYKATGGIWQIWLMDANGANQKQVTLGVENARFPVWSPNGQQLVYNTAQRDETTPKDIWVIDQNGANPRLLISGGQNGRPFWVEDYIFFNSDRDKTAGHSDIYAIKSDGSNRQRLTSSANDIDYYNPVWIADS